MEDGQKCTGHKNEGDHEDWRTTPRGNGAEGRFSFRSLFVDFLLQSLCVRQVYADKSLMTHGRLAQLVRAWC